MHLLHKHSMPPTGPRVMDSPIRPSPPGLERRWKVAARGTQSSCSCSGCQSLVSGPLLGHFPSVIILLASRWPDDSSSLSLLFLSFLFLLSLRVLFASFSSFSNLFRFLFLSSCNLSPFPTVSSRFISSHILASFFFYLGLVHLSSPSRPRLPFNPLSPSPQISRSTLLRVTSRETYALYGIHHRPNGF